MRVTNKMLSSNMLNNINRNKQNMGDLGDQKSTGQKIQRPSQDPVVAVRSLKFRSNMTELTQYLSKNIPDADAWMSVSEGALTEVNNLLGIMNKYCVQGSNDSYETDNRDTIVANLKQYKEQIYSYGNSDYAGRYVFTGYRTDVPLLFKNDSQKVEYEITEPLDAKDLNQITYVTGGEEYVAGTPAGDYEAPKENQAYRMRLSYNNISSMQGLSYTKKDGTNVNLTVPGDITVVSVNDPNPYEATGNQVKFIKETGELIFSDSRQQEISEAKNINAVYSKNSFKKEELRPEHYFDCKTYQLKQSVTGGIPDVDGDGNPVMVRDTTTETLYKRPGDQKIEYQINFGQKLRVNTMANESITHKLGRDIDEILEQVNKVMGVEKKLAEVEKLLKDENLANNQAELDAVKALKEQVDNELVLEKKILANKFGNAITSTQKAQDGINESEADLGSRHLRLLMTESRLENQKVDFAEMQKNNDMVEMEDAIINFESAKITYNASLSTASKIVQNTLLDFL